MYKNNSLAIKAKNGCQESKDLLLKENMNMIYKVANIYSKDKDDFSDLVQEGILGFLISLFKWEDRKSSDFTTYAYYWVKFKIADSILKNKGIKLFKEKRQKKSLKIIFEIEEKIDKEIIPYFNEESFEMYNYEKRKKIINCLYQLSSNERTIICYRFGFGSEKKSLKELSFILKISMSNISKVEKKALNKMKSYFNEEGIYVMSQL